MTITRIYGIVLAMIMLFVFATSVSASGGVVETNGEISSFGEIVMPTFDVPCRTALLMCSDTGDVLYEKDADKQVPVASITKIMTLILTFEAIDDGKVSLSDNVPISKHAYSMGGSQIWLEPGEIMTLDEMVKAICVSSANDAAVAVAEFIGGTEDEFANMMNEKAKELGMENSHFMNACGLDEANHYSSARDVAIMSRELMKHEKVLEYTSIWTDTLRNGETLLTNTNKLLPTYTGITGLKTGTTSGAGVCISATAMRDELNLNAVVLGSGTGEERFDAARTLLDYGFATYEKGEFPMENKITQLDVRHGQSSFVQLEYTMPENVLLKKGESALLSSEICLPEELIAPVTKGDEVGKVILKVGENEYKNYPIIAISDIAEIDFWYGFNLLKNEIFHI